jgi:hypothetical protein
VIPLTPANNRYFVFQYNAELFSVFLVECARRFCLPAAITADGLAIMRIRVWHGGLRDFRADWRVWSRSERVAAGLLAVSAALLPLLLHG